MFHFQPLGFRVMNVKPVKGFNHVYMPLTSTPNMSCLVDRASEVGIFTPWTTLCSARRWWHVRGRVSCRGWPIISSPKVDLGLSIEGVYQGE